MKERMDARPDASTRDYIGTINLYHVTVERRPSNKGETRDTPNLDHLIISAPRETQHGEGGLVFKNRQGGSIKGVVPPLFMMWEEKGISFTPTS